MNQDLTLLAVQRTDPSFSDDSNTYLLPQAPALDFQASDLMCKSSQTQGSQANGPVLKAPQGSRIVLRYLENGHVTYPNNPPGKNSSGEVFVYATTQSAEDDKFTAIHGQWNSDKSGGDQRGYLLLKTYFDDDRCYQFDPTHHSRYANDRLLLFGPGSSPTEAPNRWCGTIVPLVDEKGSAIAAGTLITLYWVWDWPSFVEETPGAPKRRVNQVYTSCMDVEVVDQQ